MSFILIYTTHENKEEADKITSHLLEKKLVACANIFPINSTFWWLWKIERSDEVVTILKTKRENWEIVKKEIKKLHPYKIPCIIKIEVEANEEYENWIREETI